MAFNLYKEWLGLSTSTQPSSLYELLDLPPFCADQSRIEEATRTQMRKLHTFQNHPEVAKRERCHKMLREVAGARVILTTGDKKRVYDAKLAKTLGVEPPEPAPSNETSAPQASSSGGAPSSAKKREAAVQRHVNSRQAISSAVWEERLNAFFELALAHFLRYGAGEIEEQLLAAEAQVHGVPSDAALDAIRRAASAAIRERQLERRFLRRTLTFGGAAAALIILAFAGVQLTRYWTGRQVEAEISRIQELVHTGQWEQARSAVAAAVHQFADHSSRFETIQRECAEAEYQEILRDARNALDRKEWARTIERIGAGRSLFPHDSRWVEIQDAMWRCAIDLSGSLCGEAHTHTLTGHWDLAKNKIAEAGDVLRAAGVPTERHKFDQLAQIGEVQSAEESDWQRLSTAIHTRLGAWEVEEAEKALREASGRHPKRSSALRDLGELVAQHKRSRDDLKKSVDALTAAKQYGEARATIAKSGMPASQTQSLLERVCDASDADILLLTRRAQELARATAEKSPFAAVGVCRVSLDELNGNNARDQMNDELREAKNSIDLPAPNDETLTLTTFRMTDGSVIVGELVAQNTATVEIRSVRSEDPLTFAAHVESRPTSAISSRETKKELTGDDARRARQGQIVAEIDAAINESAPLVALDALGRLVAHYPDGHDGPVGQRAEQLRVALREVADCCLSCLGTGKVACDNNKCSDGNIASDKDCTNQKCKNGRITCPTCDGDKKAPCGCTNGQVWVDQLTPVRQGNITKWKGGWKTCDKCHGNKEIDCKKCDRKNTVECKICHGKGKMPGTEACPRCNRTKQVDCLACKGSKRRTK